MDELLIKSGLYGGGLVSIKSPLLVERYNECLRAAGIKPTACREFDIDGKGWSPQIAEEKGNPFYLSNHGAVQFGIILTPDQKGKPIYRPYYAFERYVLDTVFATSSKAIADLTSKSGIWLQIDPGVIRFSEPSDLVLVESVDVTLADTAGIMAGAIEQETLVGNFRSKPEAWSDEELRKSIIANANKHGDLRFRDIIIPRQNIRELEYFYAEIFGGTFSIKSPGMKDSLLIVADETFDRSNGASKVHKFKDADLIVKLFDNNFVEISAEWYRQNRNSMDDLWDSILADVIYSDPSRHDIDFASLTAPQKRRYANDIANIPKEFFELERFRKLADSGREMTDLSDKLRMMLMRPKPGLTRWATRVLWRLISRMTKYTGLPTISIVDLYLYDKPAFFASYSAWPVMQQKWAIEHLKRRGLCPGGKSEYGLEH